MGLVITCLFLGLLLATGIGTWLIVHNSRRKVKPNSAIVRLGYGGTKVFLKPGTWVHCIPQLHNCQEYNFRSQEIDVQLTKDNHAITSDDYRVIASATMTLSTKRDATAVLAACSASSDGNPWSEQTCDLARSQLVVFLKDYTAVHSLAELSDGTADETLLSKRLSKVMEPKGFTLDSFSIGTVKQIVVNDHSEFTLLNANEKIRNEMLTAKEETERHVAHLTERAEVTGAQNKDRMQQDKRMTDDAIKQIDADSSHRQREMEVKQKNISQHSQEKIQEFTSEIDTDLNQLQHTIENSEDLAESKRQQFADERENRRQQIQDQIRTLQTDANTDAEGDSDYVDAIGETRDRELKKIEAAQKRETQEIADQEKSDAKGIRQDEEHSLEQLRRDEQERETKREEAIEQQKRHKSEANQIKEDK